MMGFSKCEQCQAKLAEFLWVASGGLNLKPAIQQTLKTCCKPQTPAPSTNRIMEEKCHG